MLNTDVNTAIRSLVADEVAATLDPYRSVLERLKDGKRVKRPAAKVEAA